MPKEPDTTVICCWNRIWILELFLLWVERDPWITYLLRVETDPWIIYIYWNSVGVETDPWIIYLLLRIERGPWINMSFVGLRQTQYCIVRIYVLG